MKNAIFYALVSTAFGLGSLVLLYASVLCGAIRDWGSCALSFLVAVIGAIVCRRLWRIYRREAQAAKE